MYCMYIHTYIHTYIQVRTYISSFDIWLERRSICFPYGTMGRTAFITIIEHEGLQRATKGHEGEPEAQKEAGWG